MGEGVISNNSDQLEHHKGGDRREEPLAKKILWWVIGIMTTVILTAGGWMFASLADAQSLAKLDITNNTGRIIKLEAQGEYTNEKLEALLKQNDKLDDKIDLLIRRLPKD